MHITQSFTKLLTKDMDRREFLLYIGSVAVALVGISGFIKTLTDPHGKERKAGYGGSSYGGHRKLGTVKRGLD
jgi:hypothetical protein